ncbi:hypothetical protein AMC75_08480 [Staphylococcus carnosus]|uniref:Uncharacterized protein n=1 Tax=Staphylococcus carnosus TaxID=1281 RepID=A0AAJ0JQR3_STACA|nr:hypothetical protein BEK99_12735 [Staphylococcus carnosus]KKB25673.1 hypothetical protein VV61_06255 [Staphylococcus carnosus]KOR12510.1 hypothetical protein AMC75_08480 [Staphylococcus carnosus]POA07193.1 hypothetical protein CD153_01495 [Staphylococcus carnosus]UTB77248.1 hypothetical protein A2I62_01070 [Staphylococcus carnosus]
MVNKALLFNIKIMKVGSDFYKKKNTLNKEEPSHCKSVQGSIKLEKQSVLYNVIDAYEIS